MFRRSFIKSSGAMGLAIGTGIRGLNHLAEASYKLKTSCNMFSFNKLLTEGTMSLPKAIEFCGELGFDAVDPTGYYLDGYPEVPGDAHLYSIKNVAFNYGMAISGTGIRNDFALPEKSERIKQIEFAKRWIEVAAKLDAPVIRLFAGSKIPDGVELNEVKKWIVDALHPCIEFGKAHGVIITLQNHFDAIKSMEDVKSILDQFDSPWFGLNLDIGSLRLGDPYEDIKVLIPYAKTWQIKENIYLNNVQVPTDVKKLIGIIKDGEYRGYIPVETLAPSDPLTRLKPFLEEIESAIAD